MTISYGNRFSVFYSYINAKRSTPMHPLSVEPKKNTYTHTHTISETGWCVIENIFTIFRNYDNTFSVSLFGRSCCSTSSCSLLSLSLSPTHFASPISHTHNKGEKLACKINLLPLFSFHYFLSSGFSLYFERGARAGRGGYSIFSQPLSCSPFSTLFLAHFHGFFVIYTQAPNLYPLSRRPRGGGVLRLFTIHKSLWRGGEKKNTKRYFPYIYTYTPV